MWAGHGGASLHICSLRLSLQGLPSVRVPSGRARHHKAWAVPERAPRADLKQTGRLSPQVCLGCRPSGRQSRTDGWRRKVAHLPLSLSCPSGREGWAREHLTRRPPTRGKETGGPPRPLQAVRVESFNKRTELVSTSMRTHPSSGPPTPADPRPGCCQGCLRLALARVPGSSGHHRGHTRQPARKEGAEWRSGTRLRQVGPLAPAPGLGPEWPAGGQCRFSQSPGSSGVCHPRLRAAAEKGRGYSQG